MECSAARGRSGCDATAVAADRPAHQCGISERIFDAACEHHDGGAIDRFGIARDGGSYACVTSEAGRTGITRGGRGQETARCA